MATIRTAHSQDCPAVEAIVAAVYLPYVARIGREPGPMKDDYAALIEAGVVHVIEAAGRVCGVLVLIAEDGVMLLDNVVIDPSFQGRGFGRRLLQFAEETACVAGYRKIRLYTNVAMVENIALYRRIGYVETHRAEEKGYARVYMTKPLQPSVRP